MNQNPAFKEHMNNALITFDQVKSLNFFKEKLALNETYISHYEVIIKQIKGIWHTKRSTTGTQIKISGFTLLYF